MTDQLPPSLQLLRPEQWIKNSFVLAALIFSGRLLDATAISRSIAAFAIFCGLASTVYVFNDLRDRVDDANHPHKRLRPLPSGTVSLRVARALLVGLGVLSIAASAWLGFGFGLTVATYVALNVAYTLWLKRVVLLDVMVVAANYVIRVLAGALAIVAPITPWLLIASTLLALFIALGKRRHELVLLGDGATCHRAILREYSTYFLDQLIAVVTASTVVIYALYTMDGGASRTLGTALLPLTIPFVLFGVFRYLYLIHRQQTGGNPAATLLTDRPLLINIMAWALALIIIIYIL